MMGKGGIKRLVDAERAAATPPPAMFGLSLSKGTATGV